MESQLVGYLQESRSKHGIYLVGYYNCQDWDTEDRRHTKCNSRGTLEDVRAHFSAQAEALSTSKGLNLRAVVLDASLTPSSVLPT